MQKAESKKNWTMSAEAFQRLLRWLDEGDDTGGRNYLEMRRRLVLYFDRKNCLAPDELADETLNRVARRLEEEGKIETEAPAKYCYITARFVFMESLRAGERGHVALDDALRESRAAHPAAPAADEEKERREKMLECLEHCTQKLEPVSREIILGYYFGEERVKIDNRRALAARLSLTVNALSIRACRIRDKLEACVGKCAGDR